MIFPITLFIIGCTIVTVLTIVAVLSINYYLKAKEIAPYLLKLEEVQRQIAEAQTTHESLKHDVRQLNDELASAERCIADGKAAKEWLVNEVPKIEVLKSDLERLQQRLKGVNENLKSRQDELDNLTQQVSDKSLELKGSLEKKQTLGLQNARLVEENNALEAQIKTKQEVAKNLATVVEALRVEKNELEASVARLRQDTDRLEKQLKEEVAARNSAQNELALVKKDLARVQGEYNEASKVLAEFAKHRETSADCWQDLDAPYIQSSKALEESKLNEDKWLRQFSASLEKNGIKFDMRSIKAFHTGLKCADISSLVVLAGISGTGKSLLPELYAASLGMNFLSVAVQPRWDSPQDLFGFYNYMEGRYKATELARLLWQFDRYNNPGAIKKYKTIAPMNLILLDEMNLARVEYYFSDMLSKLEIRNGIDPQIPEQRQKAEIEIESAAAASKNMRRRLFVDKNTLFVGTMNEDESTQTLSDKVIDRSNVLRFGRPEDTKSKPDKSGFLSEFNNVQISEKNWSAWKTADQSRINKMRELVKNINPALDIVGRPYAYRVSQAMESYVGLYPGTSESDFLASVADQIEMKILPKLNGIELDIQGFDQVYKELEDLIIKLQDDKLALAFKKACDTSINSFFRWRGVMR